MPTCSSSVGWLDRSTNMNIFSENWFFILLLGLCAAMHLFGHRRCAHEHRPVGRQGHEGIHGNRGEVEVGQPR